MAITNVQKVVMAMMVLIMMVMAMIAISDEFCSEKQPLRSWYRAGNPLGTLQKVPAESTEGDFTDF